MLNENAMVGFVSLTPDYNTCCSEIYNGVTLTDYAIDGDREYPSTTMRSSDTMDKTDQKGDGSMSFVGMLLLEDRIIAFGDSKPTIITALGTQAEDEDRGHIKKVFSNDHFVLATSNINQFPSEVKHHIKRINIEEWLQLNIDKYKDPLKLMQNLSDCMLRNSSTIDNAIWFMIGSRSDDGYFIQNIKVYSEGMLIERKQITVDLYVQGFPYYTNQASAIKDEMKKIGLQKIDEDDVKTLIEKHIKSGDDKGGYNPAGCPVNVIEWRHRSTT